MIKSITLLLFCVLFAYSSIAQIVNIPDPNFKAKLLAHNPVIDTNGDGEIQVEEAREVDSLTLMGNFSDSPDDIVDLEGIEEFLNLKTLECGYNQLTTLDVSNLNNLTLLRCYSNHLKNITFGKNDSLKVLSCSFNELNGINFEAIPNLNLLFCSWNKIELLDISPLKNLEEIECAGIIELRAVNMPKLTIVSLYEGGQLNSLIVSGTINIEYLDVRYNNMNDFDRRCCMNIL